MDRDEAADVEAELEEATVWIEGLDKLNAAGPNGKPGILFCADTSATPFYIHGSGHPEGYPFPWIVSDFGLVDAIESGIVKIPRLPVSDTTSRPEAKYFRLWRAIDEAVQPGERLPGRASKPKPEIVYREAQPQVAGQTGWMSAGRPAGPVGGRTGVSCLLGPRAAARDIAKPPSGGLRLPGGRPARTPARSRNERGPGRLAQGLRSE